MTEQSDIFIVTNVRRNGYDNVVSHIHVLDNGHAALDAVLEAIRPYSKNVSYLGENDGNNIHTADPEIVGAAVEDALDRMSCRHDTDPASVVSLGRTNSIVVTPGESLRVSGDMLYPYFTSTVHSRYDTNHAVVMAVDIPRGLIVICDGIGCSSDKTTWDRIDDVRRTINIIQQWEYPQPTDPRLDTNLGVLEALHDLREDRFGCLEQSVETLLGLDPDNAVDKRERDKVVRKLGGNSDEFLAAVVEEATCLRQDMEDNDEDMAPEPYRDEFLYDSVEVMGFKISVLRMRYFDREWELIEKSVKDELPEHCRDRVVLHGTTTNDTNKDSCARWIDVLDENGRSCAHVSVGIGLHEYMLSNHVESGSVACAFDLDGCFIVKEWATVDDDDENGIPSPISDMRIRNVNRHQADVAGRGELRNSILRAVLRMMGEVRNDGERQESVSSRE